MTESDPLEDIRRREPRYPRQAIEFVSAALHRAHEASGREGHVTGRELLEAFRRLAIEEFGPLARTVLAEWNVHGTEDVGRIVFLCVDAGQMGKTDDDTPDDFAQVYDFADAFPQALGEVRVARASDDDEEDDESDDETDDE